ncbi:MAG: restriction endonuclease subunit S [Candidatus Micrarchaeia archaeon]|jgi:type I restriction enzyme S subunit
MNEEKLPELPKGWIQVKLEEFSDITQGQSPPSITYNKNKDGLPFYQGKTEFSAMYPIAVTWCSIPKKIAEKGDVLISVRAPVGPTNICPEKSCIGRGLAAIRPLGGISSRFLLYLLRSSENDIARLGTGTTFEAINGKQLRSVEFLLPPLPEQQRIINKIEELFSDIDNGVESLENAKTELKRYRQAVLKAAFEGKLTEKWRKNHKDELEDASKLLERIKEERKQKLGKKYKELPVSETSNLLNLPGGWVRIRLGDLISLEYGKALQEEKRDTQGNIPVYGSSGIVGSHTESLLTNSCLVVGRKGAVGTVYLSSGPCWPIDTTYYISDYPEMDIKFLFYLLKSLNLGRLDKSTAIPGLRREDVYYIQIGLPSITEQRNVIKEIELRLSVADETEKIIDQSLKQAERMRQTILRKAFEGRLASQDPSDEPANKLLERIKAEKAKNEIERKGRKR